MKNSLKIIVLAGMLGMTCASAWGGWVQDGGSANRDASQWAVDPSLAISAGGVPYIAWHESYNSNNQVYVSHWDTTALGWVRDGGSLNINGSADGQSTSLAFAPNGTLYMSWDEGPNPHQLNLKKMSGNSWSLVASSANRNAAVPASNSSLVIAPNGTPYIAWQEGSGFTYSIYVSHWNGSGWQQDGGVINTASDAGHPCLAITPNNTLWVSWVQYSVSVYLVYVAEFDGLSTWTIMGSTQYLNRKNTDNADSNFPCSLAVAPNGTIYAAWSENTGTRNSVYVDHWAGAWVANGAELDRTTSSSNYATSPTIAVSSNNTPYVSWSEGSGTANQIYVSHWDGAKWVPDQGGLNRNIQHTSTTPGIAFAPNGNPYVTFDEAVSGTADYLLYMNHLELPQPAPPSSSATVKTYNNQINPLKGEKATIKWSQPADGAVTVTVYNLLGDRVVTLVDHVSYSKTFYNQVIWDGRNRYGQVVGSGIYIVDVTGDGYEAYGKVAVVK